ncbi:MAG: hypothetical protein K0M49_20100 [Arenimonas sp.]|nr:hypothetical protein [Arenimonas sp.]
MTTRLKALIVAINISILMDRRDRLVRLVPCRRRGLRSPDHREHFRLPMIVLCRTRESDLTRRQAAV